MTFVAIKAAILALAMAFGCAGGPDEFELGYGHIWTGDSSLEGWELANDDSDMLTVGLVWKLRPTEVIVRNPYGVRTDTTSPLDIRSGSAADPQDVEEAAEEEHIPTPAEVVDALGVFDTFGTVTKIGFFALLGLLIWIGRHRIARWFPGGNGEKKG